MILLGKSGEGNDYSAQYSCLENSMNRGAWWAAVLEVTKSDRVTNASGKSVIFNDSRTRMDR